jgi:hypothetical protein
MKNDSANKPCNNNNSQWFIVSDVGPIQNVYLDKDEKAQGYFSNKAKQAVRPYRFSLCTDYVSSLEFTLSDSSKF